MIKIILFILFSIPIFAQSASDIFREIQTKFNSLSDLQSDYKSEINFAGNSNSASGKFFYKKEKKIRVELKGVNIISDGVSFWNYNKNMNRVIIQNLNDELSIVNFTNYFFEFPEDCSFEFVNSSKYKHFIRILPNQVNDFKEIEVGAGGNFILKYIKIVDPEGNLIELTFSNIKTDSGLKDDFFIFNIPDGAKVIDLR